MRIKEIMFDENNQRIVSVEVESKTQRVLDIRLVPKPDNVVSQLRNHEVDTKKDPHL